jgi:serine/threonine-protein kinase RsbW
MSDQTAGRDRDRSPDTVEIRIPATSAYVVLLRSAVGALASRLDFTLDRLDDLRLAVDEAAALLLGDAAPDSDLIFRATEDNGILDVTLLAPTRKRRPPVAGSFAWTVLTALVDEVRADVDGDVVTISLRASRGG